MANAWKIEQEKRKQYAQSPEGQRKLAEIIRHSAPFVAEALRKAHAPKVPELRREVIE